MAKRFFIVVAWCLLGMSFALAADVPQEKQMTLRDGITISYPPDLEKEAQIIADIAGRHLVLRRARYLQLVKALDDREKVARRITEWLGCPEYTPRALAVLNDFHTYTTFYTSLLTQIRLVREEATVNAGADAQRSFTFTFGYAPGTQRVSLGVGHLQVSPEDVKAGTAALTLRIGKEMALTPPEKPAMTEKAFRKRWEAGLCRVWEQTIFLPAIHIHEATEAILGDDLTCIHPYARWFNEGLADWMMITLVSELLPRERDHCIAAMRASSDDAETTPVNLPAWVQADYRGDEVSEAFNRNDAPYFPAYLAMARLLKRKSPKDLAAVIQLVKQSSYPTTDTLCSFFSVATRRDARKILLEYVPDEVRKKLKGNQPAQLAEQAQRLARAAKYPETATSLASILQMTPNDLDARFNLIWAQRKSGAISREQLDLQLKILVALLRMSPQPHEFQPYARQDAETFYLIGRLHQHAEEYRTACGHYELAVRADPQHAEARAALNELMQK